MMKSPLAFFVLVVNIFLVVGRPEGEVIEDDCMHPCTYVLNPVCGAMVMEEDRVDYQVFGSQCFMERANACKNLSEKNSTTKKFIKLIKFISFITFFCRL